MPGTLRRVPLRRVDRCRDWMRPEPADVLGNRVLEVLRARPLQPGEGIVEALGRPLIIDFVADTGDDRGNQRRRRAHGF